MNRRTEGALFHWWFQSIPQIAATVHHHLKLFASRHGSHLQPQPPASLVAFRPLGFHVTSAVPIVLGGHWAIKLPIVAVCVCFFWGWDYINRLHVHKSNSFIMWVVLKMGKSHEKKNNIYMYKYIYIYTTPFAASGSKFMMPHS